MPAFWFLILVPMIVIVARWWERKESRRRQPSIIEIELGQMRFEVLKGQLLTIEMKHPRFLRYGHLKIVPLMGEPIVLSIGSNGNFVSARNLLAQFAPSRVKMVEHFT